MRGIIPGKATKFKDWASDHRGQRIHFSQGKDINKQRRKDFFEDPKLLNYRLTLSSKTAYLQANNLDYYPN